MGQKKEHRISMCSGASDPAPNRRYNENANLNGTDAPASQQLIYIMARALACVIQMHHRSST